jgi:hypothetical protein
MSSDESILGLVIHDARVKGATIYSWNFSQNGRIIIHDTRYLPQYFSNIAWAVDSIIHSYNLKTKYKYLYEKIAMSPKYISVQQVDKVDNSRLRRAIKACDSIVLHDDSDFLVSNQLKVYAAIQKAHHRKPFEYGEYILMQNSFLHHYTELCENAPNKRQKEHLKRVLRFFHEMTFIDINEMM